MRTLKLALLTACKYLGVFLVFRLANRRRIPILCYHGFALNSEQSRFRPKLLMDPGLFERRMEWLKRSGYWVLPLGDAVKALQTGTVPRRSVVITMDDGLYGVFVHGAPVAQRLGIPVTVYVTTWFVENQLPIFNLVVQYLFWRAGKKMLATSHGECDERGAIDICDRLGAGDCLPFLAELATAAGVDFDGIRKGRLFGLMTAEEIRSLADQGVDIQLHTHRHRWPHGEAELQKEIDDNVRVLAPLVNRPLAHICYPSGKFSERHFEMLRAAGIESATTLEHGLADERNEPLRLPRLLDGSNVSQVEFEAQLCGLTEFIEKVSRRAQALYLSDVRRLRTVP